MSDTRNSCESDGGRGGFTEPRACVRLEAIGDTLNAIRGALFSRDMERAAAAAGMIGRMSGRFRGLVAMGRRPWVARITGRHERYRWAREFLEPTRDYAEATGNGQRGVYYHYWLSRGVYEVYELLSWRRDRRWFGVVTGGTITEIKESEIEEWLNRIG